MDAVEYAECEAIVKDYPPFIEAMKKRGIDDMDLVMVNPWCVGYHREADAPSRRLAKPLIFCRTESDCRVHAVRRLFEYLDKNSLNFPVIHHIEFPKQVHRDDLVIGSGTNAGALLVDGLGDGILLEAPDQDFEFLRNTSFNLLQGCRMRNTKTEYVSCPSCGRTLFDLQEISAEIREKTSHLPGVSIAIMGCIVNGPGEMADADFGYVGGAPGKIDLYVGKTVVKRAIAMEQATDALIDLIKEHGRWVDPPTEE